MSQSRLTAAAATPGGNSSACRGALVFGWTFVLRDAIIPCGQIRTQAGASMKTVVFASVHDAARSKMAAAFFNAFTMPSLVRAVSGGTRPLLWVAPEIVQVMHEV